MNRDPVLANLDLMDEHYNLPFYNTDQRHYMHGNTSGDHMAMTTMGESTSSSSLRFMSSTKGATSSKSLSNRANLNSINQTYSHGINSPVMSPLGSPMMNSPTMITTMDQNSSNSNQLRYNRVAQSSVMGGHYEAPLMQHTSPYHQANLQNHHSPSPNRPDLNHFNDISNTLTHISETDNSHNSNLHNNFVPTPQPQSIGNSNSNIITTPQNYSSMNCHPTNNWISSSIASELPVHSKNLKNNGNHSNYTTHRNDNQFSYLSQQNHLSITSTPVTSCQSQNDRLTRLYQAPSSSCAKPTNDSLGNSLMEQNSKLSLNENTEMLVSLIKKDGVTTEKRTVVVTTIKVIEQIVDIASKNVIKEKVIKNEEVIIPLGQVLHESSNNDSTTISTSIATSHVGSSGNLGDISALSNTKSVNNQSSVSVEFQNNPNVLTTSFAGQNETKEKAKPGIADNVVDGTSHLGIDENDEEERRQTASALLSLQTASNTNTPVKDVAEVSNDKLAIESIPSINMDPVMAAASKLTDLLSEESESKSDSVALPTCERLGAGVKVMAKWKDKNFYPAELVHYLEANKWRVRFCADDALRNLHESEMIRLEYLTCNQDVMLSISSEFCTRGTIKRVHLKDGNDKTFKFDLEHLDEESQKTITKTYSLKDIFLNTEQGADILNKFAKPGINGAVFADVDLDNIVTGKRSRSKAGLEENKTGKKTTKKSSDSSSESDGPTGRKRKRNNAQNKNKLSGLFKNNDFRVIGHESSLCLSPRTNRSTLSMPAEELETILGPIPKQGSKIFENINFLLTSGTRTNKNVISDNFQASPSRSVPFDKEHLVKQIDAGGGKVFDTFQEMKENNESLECVLISCTYNCTIKYMQCLAAGIPIASHLWVIESCRKGTLLDRASYLLPPGFSLISQTLSSDRNIFKRSSILFRGMKFYFGSNCPEKLESLWSPVLYAAQASIVKQDANIHNIINRKMVDIIIGDSSCPTKLVERAKQLKIPVVSTEYIVQCLINGKKLNCDACDIFSYSHK